MESKDTVLMLENALARIARLEREVERLKTQETTRLSKLVLRDGISEPDDISPWASVYVDASTGDLMVKFAGGVKKTLATD